MANRWLKNKINDIDHSKLSKNFNRKRNLLVNGTTDDDDESCSSDNLSCMSESDEELPLEKKPKLIPTSRNNIVLLDRANWDSNLINDEIQDSELSDLSEELTKKHPSKKSSDNNFIQPLQIQGEDEEESDEQEEVKTQVNSESDSMHVEYQSFSSNVMPTSTILVCNNPQNDRNSPSNVLPSSTILVKSSPQNDVSLSLAIPSSTILVKPSQQSNHSNKFSSSSKTTNKNQSAQHEVEDLTQLDHNQKIFSSIPKIQEILDLVDDSVEVDEEEDYDIFNSQNMENKNVISSKYLGESGFILESAKEIEIMKCLLLYFQEESPLDGSATIVTEKRINREQQREYDRIKMCDKQLGAYTVDLFSKFICNWEFYQTSDIFYVPIDMIPRIHKGLKENIQRDKEWLASKLKRHPSEPNLINRISSFDLCSLFTLAYMHSGKGKKKYPPSDEINTMHREAIWKRLSKANCFRNFPVEYLKNLVKEISEDEVVLYNQRSHWFIAGMLGVQIRKKYDEWSLANENNQQQKSFLCLLPIFSNHSFVNLLGLSKRYFSLKQVGSDSHFTLAVLEIKKIQKDKQFSHRFTVSHFDSMSNFGCPQIFNDYIDTIGYCLSYGRIHPENKKIPPEMINLGWQINGYDCGYYLCFFILSIISSRKNYEKFKEKPKVNLLKFTALKKILMTLTVE